MKIAKEQIQILIEALIKMQKLGIGAKGEKGDAGYTPLKGIDYFDGKDAWSPIKNIDFFDGKDGKDGIRIEIRKTDTYLQWRYEGGQWQNLIAIGDLQGPRGVHGLQGTPGNNGIAIELQKTATHVQWRYINGEWSNLIALADITGAQGIAGANGVGVPAAGTTGQLLAKNSNTDYDTEWIDPPNYITQAEAIAFAVAL